jgi:hypothetical protein
MMTVLGADYDKICAEPGIIIAFHTDGTAVVDDGVIFHGL